MCHFLGKSCQLSVPSVHFVAAYLYLFVFPYGVGGLDVALIVLVPELTHLPQL